MEGRIARRSVLLIGAAPSRNAVPEMPLTGGRSGTRLQQLAGLSLLEYCRLFARANVFGFFPGKAGAKGDRFPVRRAVIEAKAMVASGLLRRRDVVFVGRGVARAFDFRSPDPMTWVDMVPEDCRAAWMPHPSGVNLWWNEPSNVARARQFLRELAALARSRHRLGRAA